MTKKCPFCAEEIQAEAIKCRYCGEFLVKPPQKKKWYHSTTAIIVAFLFVGPLAIPLVWLNPRYTVTVKLIVTIAMVLATILLLYALVGLYANLMDQYRQLGINFGSQ